MNNSKRKNRLSIIMKKVNKAFGLRISRRKRTAEHVYARAVYYKLARELTHYPLTHIGVLVNKDHACVLHGLKTFELLKHWNENHYIKPYERMCLELKNDFYFNDIADGQNKDKYYALLNHHIELKQKYNDNVHFLNNIIIKATRYTEQNGYITTLLGRRCRFELYENKDFHDKRMMSKENALKTWGWNEIKRAGTYRALNRLIQGSAADQTKQAMVNLWKDVGVIPMIQIHDELNVSVASETQVKEIKEIMESAVELHVPVKCDAEIGKNWGNIK